MQGIMAIYISACVLLFGSLGVYSADENLTDIHIIGLFTFGKRWTGGYANVPAAEEALADINARDDVLPGYRLVMHWNNSACDVGVSVNSMYYQLYRPPTKIMMLGTGCSSGSEATAMAAQYWNLIQVGYASSSPALSDKSVYPLFLRTYTTETLTNPAKIAVMDIFNWRRISVIQESHQLFSATTDDVVVRISGSNITMITTELFANDPALQIQSLLNHDARIILLGAYPPGTMQVICEAYKAGMYGPKYVWMIMGWFQKQFWRAPYAKVDCQPDDLEEAIDGTLTFMPFTYNPIQEVGIAGMTSNDFTERMLSILGDPDMSGVLENPTVYDGIWTIALALNKTASDLRESGSTRNIEDFHYGDSEMAALLLKNALSTDFQGIKGRIHFDDNGDSESAIDIGQIQKGAQENVGIFFPSANEIRWNPDTPIIWPGGSVPKDSTTHIIRGSFVSETIYIIMCCSAGVGIVLACCLLGFNIYYRKNRLIKMSSPVMNNIILVGCVVTYITVFLQDLTPDHVVLLCKLRVFTVMAGYSLSFGALFAKTWRVYVIFTNTTQRVIMRDMQLVLIVAVLLVIDVVVFVVHQVIDPEYIVRELDIVAEYDGGDLIVEAELLLCTSNYGVYFQGVIYTYKGLMLMFGAFLAWQTRKVTIPALNDSQYIGMCIYNVTVLSILGVIIAFALERQIQIQYVLTSAFLILGTAAIQLIIFIPKIVKVRALGGRVDSADEQAETSTQFSNVSKAAVTGSLPADNSALVDELTAARAEVARLKAEVAKLQAELESHRTVTK